MIPTSKPCIDAKLRETHVLYVDDRFPQEDVGAGYPRGVEILKGLNRIGARISLYALNDSPSQNRSEWLDFGIQTLDFKTSDAFRTFLDEEGQNFDVIWVSRPHVFQAICENLQRLKGKTKILYDAEAIFSEREEQKKRLLGTEEHVRFSAESEFKKEMTLAARADLVVTVSGADAARFREHGCLNTCVLSHCRVPLGVETPSFHDRRDLLFVGNLDFNDSPNVDSVCWFVYTVFPLLKRKLPDLVLHLVGTCASSRIQALASGDVRLHGRLETLTPLYNSSRLFIAPTRYSAGIPLKVIDSASAGLPVVVTDLLRNQLGWVSEKEIWSSPAKSVSFARTILRAYLGSEAWARVRDRALLRIKNDYSPEVFQNNLRDILRS